MDIWLEFCWQPLIWSLSLLPTFPHLAHKHKQTNRWYHSLLLTPFSPVLHAHAVVLVIYCATTDSTYTHLQLYRYLSLTYPHLAIVSTLPLTLLTLTDINLKTDTHTSLKFWQAITDATRWFLQTMPQNISYNSVIPRWLVSWHSLEESVDPQIHPHHNYLLTQPGRSRHSPLRVILSSRINWVFTEPLTLCHEVAKASLTTTEVVCFLA